MESVKKVKTMEMKRRPHKLTRALLRTKRKGKLLTLKLFSVCERRLFREDK